MKDGLFKFKYYNTWAHPGMVQGPMSFQLKTNPLFPSLPALCDQFCGAADKCNFTTSECPYCNIQAFSTHYSGDAESSRLAKSAPEMDAVMKLFLAEFKRDYVLSMTNLIPSKVQVQV